MSTIDLSNITKDKAYLLTSEQFVDHFMLCSQDEKDRAENFSRIMGKARQYGVSDIVFDTYQSASRSETWNYGELWEMPGPFTKLSALSPFPVSCLPKVCRDYLTEICENAQVSLSMGALPLLSVLSLVTQGKALIKNPGGGNTETLNLYTLTIADPGERKSGIFKALTAPLYQYQKEENERREPLIAEYKLKKKSLEKEFESVIKGKSKNPDRAKEISRELEELTPVYPLNLNVTDTTPEAIAVEMTKNDERIGILNDEGGIFDILSGLYSSGTPNIDLFLKAYDGSFYNICRIGRSSVSLENPLVTFGLMTQSEAFQRAVQNPQFTGRGFVHRFLFSFPESKAGSRTFTSKPVTHNAREAYKSLIYRLLNIKSAEPAVIECDKEAFYVFRDYHDQIEENMKEGGMFEYMKEWANKQFGRTLRIAGLLHLCEHEPTEKLGADTAMNAINIAMWCGDQALKAFGEINANEEYKGAKYVWGRIRKSGILELSKREILRLCRKIKSVDDLDEPLKTLEDMGYIREIIPEHSGNGRKSSPKYKVNPYTL